MSRVQWGGVAVVGGLVLSLSLVACTGSAGGEVSRPTTSPASAASRCVDATDLTDAKDGPISAGPFAGNARYWLQEQGSKLWVATSVEQKPTTANIRAQRLGTNEPPVLVHRGPDTIAVPSGDPPGLFFPGVFSLPGPGTWTITVSIGPDSGCFLVRV